MASSNFLVFAFILFLASAMAPLAQAQLLRGGLVGAVDLIRIYGTVFCSLDGSGVTNGVTNPVFSNAAVQVQCGNSGTVVSSTVTDSAGVFSILLDPTTTLSLSSLLNNCKVVVTTPLGSCNALLPAGGILQSRLQLVRSTVFGLGGNVLSVVPAGFSLVVGLRVLQ